MVERPPIIPERHFGYYRTTRLDYFDDEKHTVLEDVLFELSSVVLHFVHSTPESDRRRSRCIIIDGVDILWLRSRKASGTAGRALLD